MSEHVTDWIGAYRDGELHGERLRRVEAHLGGCAECQAELEALASLSMRLQASPPMPARTSPEQFVAQVRLRLPPRAIPTPGRARLRQAVGLWLPLGVLALWAFGEAVLLVTGLALAALPAGVRAGIPLALPPLPGLGALPAALQLLAALAEPGGWGASVGLLVLNIGLTVLAAGLAWGCLAGWWAARERNLAPSGELAG
jgi:anti-sigma factor RsiW